MKQFDTRTLALMPLAIVLNLVLGQVALLLKLPIYLDSVGTILVGVLAGPLAGALTGVLSYAVAQVVLGGTWLYFIPAALGAGLLAGLFGGRAWLRKLPTTLLAGLLTGVATALLGGFIQGQFLGGASGGSTDGLAALMLRYSGGNALIASILQSLISDPIDKVASYLLIFAIIKQLPRHLLVRFPQGAQSAPTHRRPLVGRVD